MDRKVVHLDTHVAVLLFGGEAEAFPPAVRDVVDRHELAVSPMVVLELQYLFETGRIARTADVIVADLVQTIGLTVCDLPFHRVVARALKLRWTRDPFDRLIVAQAEARGCRLVTKDRRILEHSQHAIWD
ncbi:MAG: PIN domain-containing protein [Deltaproteobacteria bacterium]|nr:PIN domain-containing protein [Deltaproteobacteria bacterium]